MIKSSVHSFIQNNQIDSKNIWFFVSNINLHDSTIFHICKHPFRGSVSLFAIRTKYFQFNNRCVFKLHSCI